MKAKRVVLMAALLCLSSQSFAETERQTLNLSPKVSLDLYCSDGKINWNLGSRIQFAEGKDLYLTADIWRYEDCVAKIDEIRQKYSRPGSTQLNEVEIRLRADLRTDTYTYKGTYGCGFNPRTGDRRTCTKTETETSVHREFSTEFEGLEFKGVYSRTINH